MKRRPIHRLPAPAELRCRRLPRAGGCPCHAPTAASATRARSTAGPAPGTEEDQPTRSSLSPRGALRRGEAGAEILGGDDARVAVGGDPALAMGHAEQVRLTHESFRAHPE